MQLTTNHQGFAPVTLDEAMRFSEMLSKSQMVPKQYQGKPEDVLVAVQWGKELGLAPLQALQNIACINGKPSVYGDAAMALVQASAICEGVDEYFEGEEGTGDYTAVCVAKRKGRNPVIARFSVNDAKRAGLWGKPGPWQAYPKRMLQMRARGFALRDAYPDVLKGLITAEEAQDFPAERDITPSVSKPANPLDVVKPVALPEPEPELDAGIPAPPVDAYAAEVEQVREQIRDAIDFEDAQRGDVIDVEAELTRIQSIADAEPGSTFALMVPGKDEPEGIYATVEEWEQAYEAMAERVANSKRWEARTRMTKLRELKEANQALIDEHGGPTLVANLQRGYQKRLGILGLMSKGAA